MCVRMNFIEWNFLKIKISISRYDLNLTGDRTAVQVRPETLRQPVNQLGRQSVSHLTLFLIPNETRLSALDEGDNIELV